MKNYFGYTRVSTIKQGEKGVSLQEQKSAIENYAQRNGLIIGDWFEEKETAAKRGRPVFNKMMKLLKQGTAHGVIIHKIDRSARNLKDWADLGDLIDQGIEVHFVNESLDMNSRGGRLSADIQAVVAADYIRNLREETRKGFYGRLKQGIYPLPAPLGYLNRGKGNPKELDPQKAPLVKKTFELYSSGKYSLDTLVGEVYSLGLRNSTGEPVSRAGLSIMLNNPFYMGIIRLRSTGERFPGIHQPLITASLFKRVQAILNNKTNTKIQKHDFLFRRMIVCKHCGYSVIGELQKGAVYYRCHGKDCPVTCIKEEMIEESVFGTFKPVQLNENEIAYLKGKIDYLRENWEEAFTEQKKALKLNLVQIQEKLDRLTDAYIDRLIERDVFEARKTSLLVEKKSMENKLSEIDRNPKAFLEKLSEFLELAGSLYTSYKLGIPEEKRDLLKIVTSNRNTDGKNVQFELNLPFRETANRNNISNSAPYRATPRTYLDVLFDKLCAYFKAYFDNNTESPLKQEG
ncbi:MAG: recombinase family protein [Nitrospiraceae bacterium]|nr:recombinase family protein [Nitrospiraceae bacterium]